MYLYIYLFYITEEEEVYSNPLPPSLQEEDEDDEL